MTNMSEVAARRFQNRFDRFLLYCPFLLRCQDCRVHSELFPAQSLSQATEHGVGLSPGRAPPLQLQPDDRHAVESSLLELAAVNRRLEEEQVGSLPRRLFSDCTEFRSVF